MAKERQKFIERQDKKKREIIRATIRDILAGTIDEYDCKPMKGVDERWRVRYGSIRIIFSKDEQGDSIIHKIDFRGNVYKD